MTRPVPATCARDPRWLAGQLAATGEFYGHADLRVLGVLWWYSASSVLLGPAVETLVGGGPVADPDLAALTLHLHPDGRLVRAEAFGTAVELREPAQVGGRIGRAFGEVIGAVTATSGANEHALWAIATDSLANRLLWAGEAVRRVDQATALAGPLAEAINPGMPRPRFVDVAGRRFVRRASCCLVYRATGGEKCTSCPRQAPDERLRRLRLLNRA